MAIAVKSQHRKIANFRELEMPTIATTCSSPVETAGENELCSIPDRKCFWPVSLS